MPLRFIIVNHVVAMRVGKRLTHRFVASARRSAAPCAKLLKARVFIVAVGRQAGAA